MDFKKLFSTPIFIASIVILVSYLFLPYWGVDQVDRDGDIKRSATVTGLQLLTNSVSLNGERWSDLSESQKDQAIEIAQKRMYTKARGCDTCKPPLGLTDKLNIFILLGALLFMYASIMKALDKEIPLDAKKMNWVKIIMLIVTGFLFTRYAFSIETSVEEGTIIGASWGILITLFAAIFIMFENTIVSTVAKQMNKSSTPSVDLGEDAD